METLPVEIIELMLNYCEPKTLALSIPQVSKLFKKYSEGDGDIWKAKCEQKYSDLTCKPPDQTWKQYYFPGKHNLIFSITTIIANYCGLK